MSAETQKELKEVPFPGWFPIPRTEEELRMLAKMDQGYLRWDATRRFNPLIEEQGTTGFEGYYIGLGMPPEDVANAIAQLGCSTIEAIKRLHRNDPSYFRRLWKVASGELFDIDVLAELNAQLLANTARLRMQVQPHTNKEGAMFRENVANMMRGKHLEYTGEQGIVQNHVIEIPKNADQHGAIRVNEQTTFPKDSLREGYRFMVLLGKSGYPLVQLAIHRRT